ncbi:hypothetical protein [uncultured Vagococcus sp.]|uniref:hypothetical protein n=1 Tax=uncultured Vagococcus sp. TaxID=189676 RepID=UPI00258EC776|nr:hypothetical protein [uncultured Vagococcus sp.]
MNTYKVEFDIDGYIYSQKMIEAFEFERNKHVLHEIIYLGAEVVADDKTLSYSDINFLTQSEAAKLNLETKVKLGTDKLLELYKDDIKKTNTMWKNIIAQSKKNSNYQPCVTHMKVTGVTMDELGEGLMLAMAGDDSSLAANPEHYGHVMTEEVPAGFEGMRMFAGPNLMRIMFAPDITIPYEIPEGYMPFTIGYSQLSDGTDMDTLAAHYIKETEEGIEMLLTCFFPEETPKELVDGHKIHLASEFLGLVKIATEQI